MRLLKMRLENFRRFKSAVIDLNEDLVALVGPNEAGKSSVLRALEILGNGEAIGPRDVRRGATGPAQVAGLYVLEEDDRAVAKSIEHCGKVAHVWVRRRSQGPAQWEFDPKPSRDLTPRAECEERVKGISDDPAIAGRSSIDPDRQWDEELFERVLKTLASRAESIETSQIAELATLADRIRAVEELTAEDEDEETRSPSASKAREARELAAESLEELARTEHQPTPGRQLVDALIGRLPIVAMFDEFERELNSTYVLEEALQEDGPRPPLSNLCALADLDLEEVAQEVRDGRFPHLEAVFEQANSRLKERFRNTWKQSDVYPHLGVPSDGVLRISVSVDGGTDYTEPEERSDGLRWFIALHSFLASRGADNPILLVDEVETHLHYDAQADLIDALMRQRLAQKVVYSTHSIGCLPPDLGRGVRAVIAEPGETSSIANSFWSVEPGDDAKVGYSPLLFAMGATLLPLTVPRYAVLVEGPADAVLLPSLFRQVVGDAPLSYRIVPGLSELDPSRPDALRQSASQVVCLTDGDQGGSDLREQWIRAGVPKRSMLDLGSVTEGCTLEDLVEPSVFADAVNTDISTWGLGEARVTPDELPATDRWNWLEDWGERNKVKAVSMSKVRVAQRVIELGIGDPSRSMLDPKYTKEMRVLHRSLERLLKVGSS